MFCVACFLVTLVMVYLGVLVKRRKLLCLLHFPHHTLLFQSLLLPCSLIVSFHQCYSCSCMCAWVCVCMWVRWSVARLCGELMVCEITDITGVGEVVAFPLCCCPQVDRGTIHIPHSTLPPSPFLDLSHCLSINLSLPHLHPHTYLFPIFHSSHLAFLLAAIMVFSPACNCTWISEAIVNLLPFQLFGKKT